MAALGLSAPGTEYGPCIEDCAHEDCAQTRRMAACVCRICDQPIGYDDRFFREGEGGWDHLVHATCLWNEVAAKREAALAQR